MTLLLGPPGAGKSTLLRALSGKLPGGLTVHGRVMFNNSTFNQFVVPRTAAYIAQTDNHAAELTVSLVLHLP